MSPAKKTVIEALVERKRAFLFSLVILVVAGCLAYSSMPKESFPEINIPYMIASVTDVGISPEDGERLIAKPLEKEFKTISGMKHMETKCYENYCYAILEFHVGFDPEKGLRETKDAVDRARHYMPRSIDEPVIDEINTSAFPVAVVNLHGLAPERTLGKIAEQLKDVIEVLPGVLEADIGGKRTEQVEVEIDPARLASYRLNISQITTFLAQTNILVPAGNIETKHGSFPLKVPGLIENVNDVLELPIKAAGDAVIKVADIANVRRNYEDATEEVRMNRGKALSLEVKKRSGANTIQTVDGVKAALASAGKLMPDSVVLDISNDQSRRVKDNLTDLQNNVISAVLLVLICVMLMLGVRAGVLVGMSIPFSFLLGLLFLSFTGSGINMMVLFGLILSVALLVDGAIVVTEYADQKLAEGAPRRQAYAEASSRMALVVISSTLTTLMAFAPLLFWPGIMGTVMRYMPMTVICVLCASLLVALVVVPAIGAIWGAKKAEEGQSKDMLIAASKGEYGKLAGYMRIYHNILDWALRRPWKVTIGVSAAFFITLFAYSRLGVGTTFFPENEPDFINVNIHARGNLSMGEKTRFVHEIEDKIYDMPYFKNVYSRAGAKSRNASEDVIGYIQVELKDWDKRPPAAAIMAEMNEGLSSVSGVIIEVVQQRKGPVQDKPIIIEVSAARDNAEKIYEGVHYVRRAMDEIGGFMNVEDTMPLPGIQWELDINKAQAAKFGVSIASIGSAVQMITRGTKVGSYMPSDLDEEIDIRVRFPEKYRALDQIGNLYVVSGSGANIPLSTFVKVVPKPKVNMIQRIDGRRIIRIAADVERGSLASDKLKEIRRYSAENPLDPDIRIKLRGEAEDSAESSNFVIKAFAAAVMMMIFAMLLQFNSFYSTFMIMFSVGLSIMGVLIGLVITRDPFSIVMTGIAVVSLAGIVINNNIVLIDAFEELKTKTKDPIDALKRTGLMRLRPVYLTSGTTALGVLPMALMLNIDFVNAKITHGSPSMAMWSSFSKSLIFGLGFATILTLVVTPCMILLGVRAKEKKRAKKELKRAAKSLRLATAAKQKGQK